MEVLSPLDAAFLVAEDSDPHVSMTIASIAIFEGEPPGHDELVTALSSRLSLVPRYHQRVRRFPLNLMAPVWVDDPHLDLDYHVRRTALPAPGGDAELSRLIGRVTSRRLDRDRPLWAIWVVEGLSSGRWALISEVHHCMVDGVAGTEIYHLLLSTTPDVDDALLQTSPAAASTSSPGSVGVAAAAAGQSLLQPLGLARNLGRDARHPRRLLAHAGRTAQGALALAGGMVPLRPSSLQGPVSGRRRYGSVTVSLPDIKRVSRIFGVTVNDVAVSATAAGFRALLLERGEQPRPHQVRSLVPINIRVPGTEGEMANRVSCMLAELPVEISDPAERLRRVHELLATAKERHEAEAGAALVALADSEPFAPVASALRALFRVPQHAVATVTTNVPGPRAPLYLLGRKLVRLLPVVPIADQVRIGVAMLSYCDELSFGVTFDRDSGDDLDVLLTAIEEDVSALVAAAMPAGQL